MYRSIEQRRSSHTLKKLLGFDFEGNLYGRNVEVIFRHKIRNEEKFSGLPALKAAIAADIQAARRWFGRLS